MAKFPKKQHMWSLSDNGELFHYIFSLVYFFWEKNKIITTLKKMTTSKAPVTEVSFHNKVGKEQKK